MSGEIRLLHYIQLPPPFSQIQVNIPKKRAISSGHDKALDKFFQQVLSAIAQHVDFQIVQCVVVAGPGFVPVRMFQIYCISLSNVILVIHVFVSILLYFHPFVGRFFEVDGSRSSAAVRGFKLFRSLWVGSLVSILIFFFIRELTSIVSHQSIFISCKASTAHKYGT